MVLNSAPDRIANNYYTMKNILWPVCLLLAPFITYGYSTETEIILNNENIVEAAHPRPESFEVDPEGEILGTTENFLTFSQEKIDNDVTRLQKFTIQEAWWYISDRGIIGYGQGLSELEALSIYLTLPETTT